MNVVRSVPLTFLTAIAVKLAQNAANNFPFAILQSTAASSVSIVKIVCFDLGRGMEHAAMVAAFSAKSTSIVNQDKNVITAGVDRATTMTIARLIPSVASVAVSLVNLRSQ